MSFTTVSIRLKLTSYDGWKRLKIVLVYAHVGWNYETS